MCRWQIFCRVFGYSVFNKSTDFTTGTVIETSKLLKESLVKISSRITISNVTLVNRAINDESRKAKRTLSDNGPSIDLSSNDGIRRAWKSIWESTSINFGG